MMKTSRQRLLAHVIARRRVSAGDISKELRMTEANARHHLAILQEQGLVEVVGECPPQGKGRPRLIYAPTEGILGHNLANLCKALLQEINQQNSNQEKQETWRSLAQKLVKQLNPQGNLEALYRKSLSQRLHSAIQVLNHAHYQAHWEAHLQSPRIILKHCPYTTLQRSHPEICQVDIFLLELLINAPVNQLSRLTPDASGIPHCIFAIT